MEDDLNEQHKQYKDQILKALYDNRGQKHLNRSEIKRIGNICLKRGEIEAYLLELTEEKMVKREKGKTVKVGKESIHASDKYYISPSGIEYVESGFVKPKSQSFLSELVGKTERTNELLESILEASHMSIDQQRRHSELLSQLTDALGSKDDSKARNILKEGLDAGKQVAIPLLIEYIKSFIPGI